MATLEQHAKFKEFLEDIRNEKWFPSVLAEVIRDNLTSEQYDELHREMKGYYDDED
jgi:hypothetical protein